MDELESLKQQLEELKSLRNKLTVDEEVKTEDNSTDIRRSLKEELEEIDRQIKEIEQEVKKAAKEYESSYKKLQVIIDDYSDKTEATKLLSEEELQDLKTATEQRKLEENERSTEVKKRLDAQKKIIKDLKNKKTRLENNIKKAEALGLTYEEYKEITSTIKKTTIMNAILEKKGLTAIIEKPAKERTKEEKEALKKAKEEILSEITQVKQVNKEYSVLDAIEALYSLEVTYKEEKKPRVTKITKNELMILQENAKDLPYKVVTSKMSTNNYVPEETPKDMADAQENVTVDISELKPAEEKVTLFKDVETNEYYARKYAVSRFKLKSADLNNEVRINGSVCYKISESDVKKIKENANNTFSPYIADIKDVTIEKEISKEDIADVVNEELDKKEELSKEDIANVFDEVLSSKEEPVVEENKDNELEPMTEEHFDELLTAADNKYIRAEQDFQEAVVSGDPDDIEKTKDALYQARNEYIALSKKIEKAMKGMETKEPEPEVKETKKPKATNIRATEEFKEELHEGNVLYNIVHSGAKLVKATIKRIRDYFHKDELDEMIREEEVEEEKVAQK